MDRINQDEKTLNDYLGALRRRKVQWLSVIVLILVISAGVAFGLPAVYRATGTILIEQQEIPTELVRSTVTSYADQRIQVINQRVMTSTNLLEVVQKYNLYIDERKKDPIEVVLEEMREDIVMEMISADIVDPRTGKPAQATIAFSVSYDSKSPV
ncbi:MAG: lipopolysaccharide biosynthesis protein, partial [Gammaproteobacteria bacterium]|nr:lipopolysaccharide biosynthesis protein [Gammaproteobacteria bacterium]